MRARRLSAETAIAVLLERLVRRGTLDLVMDDRHTVIAGRPNHPHATLIMHDPPEVARRVLRSGSVGFASSYIDGLWESPDLADLLELAARNNDHTRTTAVGSSLMWSARRAWRRLTRQPDGPAVREMVEHYDLGNTFYQTWLDPSMSYSSGIFEGNDDLHQAQLRKYQRIADMAGVRHGDRVLEIGCGWGSMAEYLADDLDCTVTALTISREQHAFVAERMAAIGLSDRVDVRLADFREATGSYDRVISIEMIESIDEAQWPDLYSAIAECLHPGGVAALQVITTDDDLHKEMVGRKEFVRSYIFPGGALPSIRILRELGDAAGLKWLGYSAHGPSYVKTLAAWEERFTKAWPKIIEDSARFDERFFRMWKYYLAYCEAGFRTGRIDGIQVAYRKSEHP